MPTILIIDGYRLMIYTRDHEPPHVHVWHRGCEAIIEFGNNISIRSNYGFERREMRAILRIIMKNQELLLNAWREIYG